MADLSALLLDAAKQATAARDAALAELAAPLPVPTAEEVSAALAELPSWAAKVMAADPRAELHDFMPVVSRKDEALANAIGAALTGHGVQSDMLRRSDLAGTSLRIDVPSLIAAAERIAARQAADAAESAWKALAGDAAWSRVNRDAGTIILGAPDGRLYTVAPGWKRRPAMEIVEEARQALHLPRWTIDAVLEAWSASLPARVSNAAPVAEIVSGYYAGATYRPVKAIAFHGCANGVIYVDLADALDLTAEELVAKALLLAGIARDEQRAALAPEASQPSAAPPAHVQASQAAAHLSRSERRRLGAMSRSLL